MPSHPESHENLPELITHLKRLNSSLRRGTQRKAIRTLLKDLDLMTKAIPAEMTTTSPVQMLLLLLVALQEQISEIDERIQFLEEKFLALQDALEASSSRQRV